MVPIGLKQFLKKALSPFNTTYRKEEEARRKRVTFYSQFIESGGLVFDVGANMGNRVEAFLKLKARVVAIDPQEVCCRFLKTNFGNRITTIQKGMGSRNEVKDFYISDAHTLSSFSKEWISEVSKERFKEYHWNEPVKVEITTLDDLIHQFGIPDFIKIDTEGFEHEVLSGLSTPAKLISFEYTMPECALQLSNCIERLHQISRNYLYNYSVGESMNIELNEWVSFGAMHTLISQQNFIQTGFGDIYAKLQQTENRVGHAAGRTK